MIQVDFIRHTSLKVTPDLCYGQTDIEVSHSFLEEAELVKRKIEGVEYDAVFSSPLSRAHKLCNYCGYEDVVRLDSRIMERNFGDWELKTWTEVNELANGHSDGSKYLDERGQIIPPNGETVDDMLHRVYHFIQDLRMERLGRVAVFCHGGVINSARYFQSLISLDSLFVEVPPYGSVTSLNFSFLDEKVHSIIL